jgi:hypothetical protein
MLNVAGMFTEFVRTEVAGSVLLLATIVALVGHLFACLGLEHI